MSRTIDSLDTVFEEPGSLVPPRTVGRAIRLLLGLWLLSAFITLAQDGRALLAQPGAPTHWTFWAFVLIGLHLTPYVVNIGFGLAWRRKPQLAVLGIAAGLVGIDLFVYGTWWAPPLALFLVAWLLYFSAHLGGSFVVSAIIATPGCEMRALPHLWTLITGRATPEHYCPGPLDQLDKWERNGGAV